MIENHRNTLEKEATGSSPATLYWGNGPQIWAFAAAAIREKVDLIVWNDRPAQGIVLPAVHGYFGGSKSTPTELAVNFDTNLYITDSIDWVRRPWAQSLIERGSVFSPHGEAMRLERERAFGMELASRCGIAVPRSALVENRAEAHIAISGDSSLTVLKNPLCSPSAPLHTIVCATAEEATYAVNKADDTEGIFLQQNLGGTEIGHIALVADGEVVPLVTNQEYKWSKDGGQQGHVVGRPLGGIVEADTTDKYCLAKQLIEPLAEWFEAVGFRGPVQVTAGLHNGKWKVMEYNVRLGVSSGPLIATMLDNPFATFRDVANGLRPNPCFRKDFDIGVLQAVTTPPEKVGVDVPHCVIESAKNGPADVWWEAVTESPKGMCVRGERPFVLAGFSSTIEDALGKTAIVLDQLDRSDFDFRQDVGRTLWPPGNASAATLIK